jgi:hypothetical protein
MSCRAAFLYCAGMSSARERVAAFWDANWQDWRTGAYPLTDPLHSWYESYQGTGLGAPSLAGFPEPYIGDLAGVRPDQPLVVLLGLNPGQYVPEFQATDGIFAQEIQEMGSYRAWAASGPYLRKPWDTQGANRYWRNRLGFTRRWLQSPGATHENLIIFECYPWHSTKVTAPMRPPRRLMDEFVFEPIGELPVDLVFAFGRVWDDVAASLRLDCIAELGKDGGNYRSVVASRAVRVYQLPTGQRLVVEWHMGGAGPPSAPETELLREALSTISPPM